jgi:hypothetical protein
LDLGKSVPELERLRDVANLALAATNALKLQTPITTA